MASVIDTIPISETLRRNVPQVQAPFPGDGLMVILDPYDPEPIDASGAAGRRASISRPDSSGLQWVVAGVEVRHGVVALYFEGLAQSEVPRLSRITLS